MRGDDMEFAHVLRTLRKRAGKSRYRIARFSGLDQAYILRLETGERKRPSRATVFRLTLALVEGNSGLSVEDMYQLYEAGGFVA